jgi:hypothetical protein
MIYCGAICVFCNCIPTEKDVFYLYTHLVFICDTGLYIIYFLWPQEKQIMVHVFNI